MLCYMILDYSYYIIRSFGDAKDLCLAQGQF